MPGKGLMILLTTSPPPPQWGPSGGERTHSRLESPWSPVSSAHGSEAMDTAGRWASLSRDLPVTEYWLHLHEM